MILVDANLLIYAVDADSVSQAPARRWLESALNAGEEVGLAWVVTLAFLRITTHPRIMRAPLSAEAAVAYVDGWLELPNVRPLVPGARHWSVLKHLLVTTGTAGNLTSDAHLAALAVETGATVYSADTDFKRFASVRHHNPLVPA